MRVRQQASQEKSSNPCAAIGRIIALVAVAFAVCALVKTFVCGRVAEDCPCNGNDGQSCCSGQQEPAESA
jgi:hypothetical protein